MELTIKGGSCGSGQERKPMAGEKEDEGGEDEDDLSGLYDIILIDPGRDRRGVARILTSATGEDVEVIARLVEADPE